MSAPVISPTCEVRTDDSRKEVCCNAPTAFGYEAMGGGWMALCEDHAKRHQPHVLPVAEIIERDGRHRTAQEWVEFRAKRQAEREREARA